MDDLVVPGGAWLCPRFFLFWPLRIYQLFAEGTLKKDGPYQKESTDAFTSDADLGVVFARGLPPEGYSRV